MSNLGKYQDIIEEAFAAGGPDKLIDSIKKDSYDAGALDMKNKLIIPLLAAGVGIGVVGTIVYKKTKARLSDKKEKKIPSDKDAAKAEILLKQEITPAIEEIKKEHN